jgi:hypothetical protein
VHLGAHRLFLGAHDHGLVRPHELLARGQAAPWRVLLAPGERADQHPATACIWAGERIRASKYPTRVPGEPGALARLLHLGPRSLCALQNAAVPQRTRPRPAPAVTPLRAATGRYTAEGKPMLFYGMPSQHARRAIRRLSGPAATALYEYLAVGVDDLTFRAGEIIAVMDAPEDGWWTGEIVDPRRREPGRYLLPPNLVWMIEDGP